MLDKPKIHNPAQSSARLTLYGTEVRSRLLLGTARYPSPDILRQAIAASEWLADFDVKWLEEPVLADQPFDLEDVAAASAIPIAAGENVYFRWGFRDLCERRAISFVQPDVGRCGGVTEWTKIAHLADSFGLDLTSHLLHEISTTLIASFPSGFAVEYMNFFETNPFTQD